MKMNLQYFAEEDTPVNPLVTPEPEIQPESTNPEPQPEPEPEFLDFGGRQVQKTPETEGLYKDWQESQGYNTKLNQTNQQLQQQLEQAMTLIQASQQTPQQVQQPTEPTQADINSYKEELSEKQYDLDPLELEQWKMNHPVGQHFYKKQMETMIKPYIEPLLEQQRQFDVKQRQQQEVNTLAQKYPDFIQYREQMQDLLVNDPIARDLVERENGLERVYHMVKGQQTQPSIEQQLSDPAFLQQHILNNESIKNQIINQYVNNVQSNQQTVQPTIGNQGQVPTIPEEKPKDLAQASKMVRQWLGLNK